MSIEWEKRVNEMVPNGMGNMSNNHTHMHTHTCANTHTHTHTHAHTHMHTTPSKYQCQAGVIVGDGEGTHTPYSFFQCRMLIDTGGSTSLQNCQCSSLAGLKD